SSCYLDWDYNSCGHEKLEDCGSNYCDTSGDKDYYCSGGDVWVRYDYYEAGCSGASCYGSWDYNSCGHEKEEDCSGSTSCGYGSCADDERPSWGCSGGSCNYSCGYDSDCEPETWTHCECSSGTNAVIWDEIEECENSGGEVIDQYTERNEGCWQWRERSGGWIRHPLVCIICEY
ncbi:MAG: hypothetical protein R6V40_01125, partial [Candidatus Moraniibacteriota bacterium]